MSEMLPNEQVDKETNPVEQIRDIIADADQLIEDELERTKTSEAPNTWLFCFGSLVSAIERVTQNHDISEQLPHLEVTKFVSRLMILQKRFSELRSQYPLADPALPDAEKIDLIKQLNALLVFDQRD